MIEVDYNEYKETFAENMKLIVENNRLKEVEKEHQKLNGELREEIKRLNNKLEEFKEEHKIMKQILIENNLWENLLNDDRFLEYLRK